MGEPPRRPSLDGLTSLRFFAALHVVAFHATDDLAGPLGRHPWLKNVVGAGPCAVSFFFVLSGFILAYTYLGPPEERRLRPRSFWAARVARIYPVYLLGLLVAAPLVVLVFALTGGTLGLFLAAAAAVLTLTQAWLPQLALAWNSPGWSLSDEAFFYLAFPLLAPPFWRLRGRGLLLALAVCYALAQLGPVLYNVAEGRGWLAGGSPWPGVEDYRPLPPGFNAWIAVVGLNPLVRLPEFVFGVVLGRLYLWDAAAPTTPDRTIGFSLTALVGAGGLLVALTQASEVDKAFPGFFLNNGLFAPLFGLVIYGLAGAHDGRLGRLLALPPLVRLGEASYALYILHVPVQIWVALAAKKLFNAGHSPALFAVNLLVVVPLSLVVLLRLEEPARRYLRRRLDPVKAA
jgi:peptidoglycan/LPS O-acetylase OafA/YrhL